MPYDVYSRTNQRILEGGVAGGSFFLAFLIRFEGAIPPYHVYQFWALVLPVIAGRLLTNFLFGLERVQWRYMGFRDALRVTRAYFAFSAVLLVLRFALPIQVGIVRVPASVIIIDLLLALFGAMSVRFLRRYIYELKSKESGLPQSEGPRRLLLIGAGAMGANAAKEMASDSSVEIVGFLDDNPRKIGCIIAGVKVLGPTSEL